MTSGTYNNNVMIFQAPGYVAILNEMVHNARIIPIDDTAKPPFPQRSGVSRAHWEGETLVIETAQFAGGSSSLSSTSMHLIERLTRIDADTVAYEYTVTDPTVYTAPYTVMMPFRRLDGTLFEYACHEGNYGLYGILAGAREDGAPGPRVAGRRETGFIGLPGRRAAPSRCCSTSPPAPARTESRWRAPPPEAPPARRRAAGRWRRALRTCTRRRAGRPADRACRRR